MKVRAIRTFLDASAGKRRSAGEVFEATAERLAQINGTRYGMLAEPIEEPKATRTRRRATGKARG